MTISAASIIHRATDLLQDQTSVRWPANELVRWLNDAQRAIVKVRPDAMNTTATMTLVAGSRQDLDNANLKGLLRRVLGKIFNKAEIKEWCREYETRNAASREAVAPLVV